MLLLEYTGDQLLTEIEIIFEGADRAADLRLQRIRSLSAGRPRQPDLDRRGRDGVR